MPAIHILGGITPGRKIFRRKSPVHGRVLEFTAERGMISMRVETGLCGPASEVYERITCAEFYSRIKALRANVLQMRQHANQDSGRSRLHLSEATELQRTVEMMAQALQAAIDQGDPMRTIGVLPANQTRIACPTYETPVPLMPSAPATAPLVASVPSMDPTKLLILPPGHRFEPGAHHE